MPWITVLSLFAIAYGISLVFSEPFLGFLVIVISMLLFIQSKNTPSSSPLALDSTKNKEKYRKKLALLYELNTGVSGASEQVETTRAAVEVIASNYTPADYFKGLNDQQIEDHGKVFKYDGFSTNDFLLKREPDNKYDSNATAVYVDNLKIGYIPKKHSKSVARAMDQYDYVIDGFLEITGGPYKEFDHYSDKILTDNNYAFGYRIEAKILNRNLL